ncbi:MAG TPA: type II CAAX endopeptidase family protein [Terriglobales bacterium]|nr:type II CAAX endopeptidase family protein [Terriglobales bacterium]
MSTPLNPLPPEQLELPQELAPQQTMGTPGTGLQPDLQSGLPSGVGSGGFFGAAARARREDPAWTIWDVLLLVVIFVVMTFIAIPITEVVVGASHLFGYSLNQILHNRKELDRFWSDLRIILPVQLLIYAFLLFVMVRLVRARARVEQGFFVNLRWRWPRDIWPGFLLGGTILAIAVQWISARLPVPPSLPIDQYFQTPTYAYLMAGFGILVAPFIEELFFRGFLYPALARPLGVAAAVILTSVPFTLMHGLQLSFAWAPMLMLLIVGVALGLVRARTKSLAPSVLVHIGYNTTIFAMIFIDTGGFKHLEKM